MNTATTSKTAASSTPTATPAASQAAGDSGAHTEQPTTLDVAGALGLNSEGQETDGEADGGDDVETQDQGAADSPVDGADTAEGDDDDAPEGEQSGESGEAAGEGETAAGTGESDTTEETAAGTEGEAAAEPGKKHEHLQQRIDELTGARKAAEGQVAQLRERLATYEAHESGALAEGPLDTITDLAALDKLDQRTASLHEWALRNPDGGKLPDGKGGETEFTREEVAHINASTHTRATRDIPARRQWLQARGLHDAEAVKSYPWLKDTAKGDGAIIQKVLESNPRLLTALPNIRLVAANALIGERLRSAGIVVDDALIQRLVKEKGGKQPAAGAKPAATASRPAIAPRAPAAPGRASVQPARRPAGAAESRAADKRFQQSSGSVDDVAASIAAKLR